VVTPVAGTVVICITVKQIDSFCLQTSEETMISDQFMSVDYGE